MPQYRLANRMVGTEEWVAFHVFDQTRTEGDVTTYEVVDRMNPAQLESRIVGVFESEDAMLALRDDLRRKYATQLDLGLAVR